MKTLKIFAASLLAAASLSVASASTIKVTGSTAFRKALFSSIVNQLGSGTVKVAYVGSSLAGAVQATFTNGTDTVQCCMAGSVGGVNWVVNNTNVATSIGGDTTKAWISLASNGGSSTWATAAVAGSAPFAVSGGTGNATIATATFDAAAPADVAMSDSYQDSTPYSSAATGITLNDVNGGVGAVTFVWAKGQAHPDLASSFPNSYARLTNVTLLGAQNLLANGIAPLAMFTGNAADVGVDVVLAGRDNDSGTRLGTFAEMGFGDVNSPAVQYKAYDGANGTGNDVGTVAAAGPIASLAQVGSTSGYAGGGGVKSVLLKSINPGVRDANGNPFIMVGYLGTGDTPGSSLELTYNGVPNTSTGVLYGADTFWTLEHMLYKSTLASAQATLADSIGNGMTNTYAPASGVRVGDMKVTRSQEGAVVNPLY